jgi:hypothetical protein
MGPERRYLRPFLGHVIKATYPDFYQITLSSSALRISGRIGLLRKWQLTWRRRTLWELLQLDPAMVQWEVMVMDRPPDLDLVVLPRPGAGKEAVARRVHFIRLLLGFRRASNNNRMKAKVNDWDSHRHRCNCNTRL